MRGSYRKSPVCSTARPSESRKRRRTAPGQWLASISSTVAETPPPPTAAAAPPPPPPASIASAARAKKLSSWSASPSRTSQPSRARWRPRAMAARRGCGALRVRRKRATYLAASLGSPCADSTSTRRSCSRGEGAASERAAPRPEEEEARLSTRASASTRASRSNLTTSSAASASSPLAIRLCVAARASDWPRPAGPANAPPSTDAHLANAAHSLRKRRGCATASAAARAWRAGAGGAESRARQSSSILQLAAAWPLLRASFPAASASMAERSRLWTSASSARAAVSASPTAG
mmetsp:Transcript_14250/g.47555  ORF Transcript_14250/g.47555 Transcript_14250/m.47555 type:complete len:293 (+) Transcript_14250:157-1035(+)